MNKKAIIPLLLGLGVGLAAVKLAVDTIKKAQAAGQATNQVKVVRARQDIEAHQMISPEMVELVETSETVFVPKGERIEAVEEVVERVAAKAIPSGTPVLASMLAPPGTPPGLQGQIPSGYRAVSVKIDEVSGVAYQINPGDWVDVIVVMDVDTGMRGRKETVAKVILQRVQVAAVGRDQSGPDNSAAGRVRPAKSATLLLKEEDVPKLHLAATRGKITLAMRGDDDRLRNTPPEANFDEVIAGLRPKKPETTGTPSWLSFVGGLMTQPPAGLDRAPVVDDGPSKPEIPPHTVLVVHGKKGGSGAQAMERITFLHPDSHAILAIQPGLPSGAGAMMDDTMQNSGVSPRSLSQDK